MVQRDRVSRYRRSRPSYCSQVVDFVLQATGGRLRTVVDVGCGTGLSTRLFHKGADTLIGVEPDADMRAVAIGALADVGGHVVDGSAEETGLGDDSADLIVAASCFGWFDLPRAALEFRRVLRANGSVLLMWHYPAPVDAASYEWERRWRRNMGPRLGPSREDIECLLVPAFLSPPRRYFCHVDHHPYDRRRLRDLAFSSRYAPGACHHRRQRALVGSIDEFHDRHAVGGSVSLAFETVAVLGRVT